MTTEIIASIDHAYKKFDKLQILHDITLDIKKGTILGLIGSSGAGKTTTIKCLMGMEKLTTGKVTIFNTTIPNRKILQQIGYMGQSDALYENLTAEDNLIFFGKLMGLKKQQLNESIQRNLALVNLTEFSKVIVHKFSGGMKRRLSLAIALLGNPKLVILDEPTVGIDPSLRVDIWQQLKRLAAEGISFVVTTHVMDEAEKCDQVGLIIKGKLLAIGTPQDLKQQFNVDTIEEVFLKAEVK